MPWRSIQNTTHVHMLLTAPRNSAVLGNMAIFAAVVTSFVASRFGTIRRDVTHFAAVEATPILGTSLVDHLPRISFQTRVGTIPSNVTRLPGQQWNERYATIVHCIRRIIAGRIKLLSYQQNWSWHVLQSENVPLHNCSRSSLHLHGACVGSVPTHPLVQNSLVSLQLLPFWCTCCTNTLSLTHTAHHDASSKTTPKVAR